jgi:hypothetical protein
MRSGAVVKITNTITGSVEESAAVSTDPGKTGNTFRYDPAAQQYIYNWSTKGLTAGTYQLRISLDDGTTHK